MKTTFLYIPVAIICILLISFCATTKCCAAIPGNTVSLPDSAMEQRALQQPESAAKTHLSFFRRLKLLMPSFHHRSGGDIRNNNNHNGLAAVILGGAAFIFFDAFGTALAVSAGITAGVFLFGIAALAASVLAIVFGAIGIHKDRSRAMAIIGLVAGIVLLSSGFAFLLLYLLLSGI